MSALQETFKNLWREALHAKNFENAIKFFSAAGTKKLECANYCFKDVTAVEIDRKKFCLTFEQNHYAFKYNEFPLSKNIFQHIQKLRVFHHPDDLSISDYFFGHDIKKISIWNKPLPEKYCEIQRNRNSLEEVRIFSKNGFDQLSIISPSCQKLEVQFFKMENIQKIVNKNTVSYPSIEHLILHEGYFDENFSSEIVKQFCEFLAKTFPNLKLLEMDADYLDKKAFEKPEVINLDEKMFEALPLTVKGNIKFSTEKLDEICKECVELVKDTPHIVSEHPRIDGIKTKVEIHDGLTFESNLSFTSEYGLCWHPFFGYKNPPLGPFCFQHSCFVRDPESRSSDYWLSG